EKRMPGPGKDAFDAIQVVAGTEVVLSDQSNPLDLWTNADMALQCHRGHAVLLSPTMRPATADSTQASMLASVGAYPEPLKMFTTIAEFVSSRCHPLASAISRA